MSPAEQFALWTVRFSLICYAATLALRLLGRSNNAARWCWTVGAILLVVHIILAMGVYHHWSHDEAFAHTARRTAELTGWNWGGGIYFNYVFLALWIADALWWWINPTSYLRQPRWIEILIQGYLAFITINATIVFGQGAVRWTSVTICIFLAVLAASRRSGSA